MVAHRLYAEAREYVDTLVREYRIERGLCTVGRSDGGLREKARRVFGYFSERFPDPRGVRSRTAGPTGLRYRTTLFRISASRTVSITYWAALRVGLLWHGCADVDLSGPQGRQKILGQDPGSTHLDRPLPGTSVRPRSSTVLPLAICAYALRDRLFR
jgi:hypothetical protein